MNQNFMEIKEENIQKHYTTALSVLKTTNFASKAERDKEVQQVGSIQRRSLNRLSSSENFLEQNQNTYSIHSYILSINSKDELTSEVENHILRLIRRSVAIFHTLYDTYESASGLKELKVGNLSNNLTETQKVELTEKVKTSSLVSAFSMVSFVIHQLENYMSESDSVSFILPSNNEHLTNYSKEKTLNSILFEYYNVLQSVDNDLSLIKATKVYFEDVLNRIIILTKTANYTEAFTSFSYRIEEDDFNIQGFSIQKSNKGNEIVMQFKKPEEVIGNMIAKSQSMRVAQQMMAYDMKRQMNPFAELGGFTFTFMGDGKPGTGKTTLIQMIAGLLNDYTKVAKYPFRYENFSIDGIDSYQGKSGQNIKAMINRILDPNIIGFGTIDDIDQIAGKRGDKQSSAGQQEVTAVLMESFAGANTIVRGNSTFGMFSNYPENVDDALRQRAGLRMLIDGPQSLEDYIDILALLIGKNHVLELGNHDLFATQNIKTLLKKSFDKHNLPQEEIVHSAYKKTIQEVGEIKTIAQIGKYLKNIQLVDERFTGRAIKNITDAVKGRSMDFDMPSEWFENPEIFLHKDYDMKMNMIKELIVPITPEMVLQQINIYADSEARYSNKSDEADIERMIRNYRLEEEAKKRILNLKQN